MELGQRFGRLIVLEETDRTKSGKRRFLCKCDCGNIKAICMSNLVTKNTTSCGCYQNECRKSNRLKHGMRHTRLWQEWSRMKWRTDKRYPYHKDYYDRGIAVCDEWESDFTSFAKWALSNGYDDSLTIDRIDNNEGYSPDNCRWVNMTIQNRNKTDNLFLVYKGKRKTVAEWAEITGMKYMTLYSRILRGWSVEEAIERPAQSA